MKDDQPPQRGHDGVILRAVSDPIRIRSGSTYSIWIDGELCGTNMLNQCRILRTSSARALAAIASSNRLAKAEWVWFTVPGMSSSNET